MQEAIALQQQVGTPGDDSTTKPSAAVAHLPENLPEEQPSLQQQKEPEQMTQKSGIPQRPWSSEPFREQESPLPNQPLMRMKSLSMNDLSKDPPGSSMGNKVPDNLENKGLLAGFKKK